MDNDWEYKYGWLAICKSVCLASWGIVQPPRGGSVWLAKHLKGGLRELCSFVCLAFWVLSD